MVVQPVVVSAPPQLDPEGSAKGAMPSHKYLDFFLYV